MVEKIRRLVKIDRPRASYFLPVDLVREFRAAANREGRAPSRVVEKLMRGYLRRLAERQQQQG